MKCNYIPNYLVYFNIADRDNYCIHFWRCNDGVPWLSILAAISHSYLRSTCGIDRLCCFLMTELRPRRVLRTGLSRKIAVIQTTNDPTSIDSNDNDEENVRKRILTTWIIISSCLVTGVFIIGLQFSFYADIARDKKLPWEE